MWSTIGVFLAAVVVGAIVTAAVAPGPGRPSTPFRGPLLPPVELWLYAAMVAAMTSPGEDGGPGSEPSGAPGPAPALPPATVTPLPVRSQVLTVPPWYDAYPWADDDPQLVCPDCEEISPPLADIPAAVAWIARHNRECNA